MAVNQFDRIVFLYDSLARLVFDNQIHNSQIHFIDTIEKQDKVLVIGGGTGKLLESIPECRKLVFVEKSSKMLGRAKKRSSVKAIDFIHSDFFEFDSSYKFDVIICPFFLDCFNESNLDLVIKRIKSMLNDGGSLLIADFTTRISFVLSSTMHVFFRLIANLEARKLLDIHSFILNNRFFVVSEGFFYRKGIFSRHYRNL